MPSIGFLTSKENIVLDIVFGLLGETRFSRDIDDWGTYYKYVFVATQAPKLEAMHADVNEVLRLIADKRRVPFEICYFKKGDQNSWFKPFPGSVSLETVRKAWKKSGMQALSAQYKHLRPKSNPSPTGLYRAGKIA